MAENTEQGSSSVSLPDAAPESDVDRFDVEFPRLFYVNNIAAVKSVIADFEVKTKTQFAVGRESKQFNSEWCVYDDHQSRKIFWKDRDGRYEKMPNDGVPFIVVGKRTMKCTFGPTSRPHKEDKIKERAKRSVDCPAEISIREIHKFPLYFVNPSESKYSRAIKMRDLRRKLIMKDAEGERRFYVSLPRMADHLGHDFDKDVAKLRTDSRVVTKLADLVYRRVFDLDELKQKLTKYVQEELFKGVTPPPLSDTRFYPSDRRMRNICYCTRIKMQEEGIAVPFAAPGQMVKKRKRKSPASKPKNSKKKLYAIKTRPPVTVESANAAEMLLMLEKDQRPSSPRNAETEEQLSSSSFEDGDNEETSRTETNGEVAADARADLQDVVNQAEEGDNTVICVEINSEEVGGSHPDKQACLELMEEMKPLILLSQEAEKIRNLRHLLVDCLADLKDF